MRRKRAVMSIMGAAMVLAVNTSGLTGILIAFCYAALVILMLLGAAGAPLPTGAVLIGLGALSAQRHGPNFLILALLATAAAVSGDILDYGLGRAGRPVLYAWLLRPLLKFTGIGINDATRLGRGSGLMVFLTRFTLTPLASPLSILVGAARVPLATFLIWDAPGDVVAVVGNLGIGRWLGTGLTTHTPHAIAFWGIFTLASLAPAILFLVVRWHRMARSRAPIGSAVCGEASTSHEHGRAVARAGRSPHGERST